MEGVDLARVDPVFHANPIRRLVQKARFEGEWFGVAQVNVPGSPLAETFRYFQMDRDGNPKGIVALDLA